MHEVWQGGGGPVPQPPLCVTFRADAPAAPRSSPVRLHDRCPGRAGDGDLGRDRDGRAAAHIQPTWVTNMATTTTRVQPRTCSSQEDSSSGPPVATRFRGRGGRGGGGGSHGVQCAAFAPFAVETRVTGGEGHAGGPLPLRGCGADGARRRPGPGPGPGPAGLRGTGGLRLPGYGTLRRGALRRGDLRPGDPRRGDLYGGDLHRGAPHRGDLPSGCGAPPAAGRVRRGSEDSDRRQRGRLHRAGQVRCVEVADASAARDGLARRVVPLGAQPDVLELAPPVDAADGGVVR